MAATLKFIDYNVAMTFILIIIIIIIINRHKVTVFDLYRSLSLDLVAIYRPICANKELFDKY